MADFHLNKFVVEIESGHPGYRAYTIIATREDMAQMVQEISQALADSEAHPSSDPTIEPFQLWQQYVTIAKGETSRVSLTFAASPDVSQFHVRPKFTRDLPFYCGCLGLIAVLILAFIGIKALIHGFVP